MTEQKRISFSPPDITQAELDEVADALRSGWITTGPKTKEFDQPRAYREIVDLLRTLL